jgi:plastocyanin
MIRPPAPDSDRAVPEFFFEPTGLHVSQGDVVRYNLATPDHTVTAYHPGLGRQRRVPEGVPPFSSPVLAGGTFWLYRYDQAGVYDMLCAPHELFGMVGRVVVGEASADWMESGDDATTDAGGTNETGNASSTEDGTPTPTPTEDGTGQDGPQLRPPELTAALVFRDPALDPSNIRNEGSVSWEALRDESKQILLEFPEDGGEE